jgi:phage N-6-adenine-methyltransferase
VTEVAVLQPQSLPSLVKRAAAQLAGATNAAEVLDARVAASAAYDVAKAAGRLAKAKQAHDDVISAVYRAQADALEIEALAKRRLADEYDAAQERGEVKTVGQPASIIGESNNTPASVSELGISSYDIHQARQIRDAEEAEPGIVRRTLDELIERGEEPTKAAVSRAIVNRTSFTGNNEWYTPAEYVDIARSVMGGIDLDPASSEKANKTVCAGCFFTEEDDGLTQPWGGRIWLNPPYAQPAIAHFADKMVAEWDSGRIESAIVLTHNYTDTAWFHALAHSATAICFTRGRVRFISDTGEVAAPTQGQAFFYFGNSFVDFKLAFDSVGFVVEVVA